MSTTVVAEMCIETPSTAKNVGLGTHITEPIHSKGIRAASRRPTERSVVANTELPVWIRVVGQRIQRETGALKPVPVEP